MSIVICKYALVFTAFVTAGYGRDLDIASDSRIVGGYEATPGQFPHQVSMRFNDRHFCGGSIIDKRYILTAAHCLIGVKEENSTVVTGSNLLSVGGDTYKVEKFLPHPEFDSMYLVHDIGLVYLSSDIVFHENVSHIEMYNNDVGVDIDLVLSGWGSISFPNGNTPNELQAINLQSISNDICAKELSDMADITENQLCTFTKAGEGACHGDSGGPLVYKAEQVGVVSWGKPCAKGKPDVFTRVIKYKDWLQKTMAC